MTTELEPVDRERCQAEKRLGAFQLGGDPKKVTRCKQKPVVIITEVKPGADGQHGKMSLCEDCLAQAFKQLGYSFFTTEPI